MDVRPVVPGVAIADVGRLRARALLTVLVNDTDFVAKLITDFCALMKTEDLKLMSTDGLTPLVASARLSKN